MYIPRHSFIFLISTFLYINAIKQQSKKLGQSQHLSLIMDVQMDSEHYQQAFQHFVQGLPNIDILKISPQFTIKGISKILQTQIDLVLDQLETTIAARHPFVKDHNYEKRRQKVIQELSDERRLIFSGPKANSLGENTVRHFLKVCKHYLMESSLKNYPFQNLYKIFRKWLLPGKDQSRSEDRDEDYHELQKKKREMEAVRIQHEILLKKSKMLQLQNEIQTLKNKLKCKSGTKQKLMQSEDSSHLSDFVQPSAKKINKEHSNVTIPLKSILKVQSTKASKQKEPKKDTSKLAHAKPNIIEKTLSKIKKQNSETKVKKKSVQFKQQSRIVPQSPQRSSQTKPKETDRGLKWKHQEQQYFVKLMEKFSIRDQSNLQAELVKKFGRKDRFSDHNIRDKKFQMFRDCRRRFLLALDKRKLIKIQQQYASFVNHFQTIDNRRAYEFQSQFMSRYYLCKMEELPDKEIREIIDAVLKQETRVLTDKYMRKKKMDKDMLDSDAAAQNITQIVHTAKKKSKAPPKIKIEHQSTEEAPKKLDIKEEIHRQEDGKDSLDQVIQKVVSAQQQYQGAFRQYLPST